MINVAETFAAAWNHHQAGHHVQAEQLYRQILQQETGHSDAWCLLAASCQAQGKFVEAEASYRQVLRSWPNHPIANNGLGIVLAQQGKLDDSAAVFEQLLRAEPRNADACNNLGLVRVHQGRHAEAVQCYERALQARPNYAEARSNLTKAMQFLSQQRAPLPQHRPDAVADAKTAFQQGVELYEQGRFEQAGVCLQQALQLQPDNFEAHGLMGNALFQQRQIAEAIAHYQKALRLRPNYLAGQYNLGVALQDQGNFEQAAAQYRNTIRLDPRHESAHNNLGLTLMELGKLTEASQCFQEALRLNPTFLEACVNLGTALHRQNKLDEALHWCHKALQIDPQCVAAWNNQGMVYKKLGRFDEALENVEKALRINPDDPLAHWNRAVIWLLRGDLERGWPEHECRWIQPGFGKRSFTQPLWDGSPLGGKTILLYAEQGLGDTLQFVRYVPLVKERGGTVIVQCHRPLLRLLESVPGIDRFEVLGAPLSAFDVHAALLSLPGIFHTTLDTIPAPVPYLKAEPELVERWQAKLAPLTGFKIGIAWQGNPQFREDSDRSIPLRHLARLAELDGVQLVSLQKGFGREQLHALPGAQHIHDFVDEMDEASGAFMDTAAVMKNLDLVISSDTAIPHLAGALAVPVWVLLARIPDWRWMLDREDCPWYPTMKLFRQRQSGDWAEVMDRLAAALRALVAGR